MDFEPEMIHYSLHFKLLKTFFGKRASVSHLHREHGSVTTSEHS